MRPFFCQMFIVQPESLWTNILHPNVFEHLFHLGLGRAPRSTLVCGLAYIPAPFFARMRVAYVCLSSVWNKSVENLSEHNQFRSSILRYWSAIIIMSGWLTGRCLETSLHYLHWLAAVSSWAKKPRAIDPRVNTPSPQTARGEWVWEKRRS